MLSVFRRMFVLSVVSLMVGAGARADEGVVLRHKFAKGGEAIYKNSLKMTQSQNVGGMAFETQMDQVQVLRQTVDEVDSQGQAKLRLKGEQMQMKMTVKPVIDYSFDSKKTDNDRSSQIGASMTPILERLASAETSVELDTRGNISKAKGQLDQIKDLLEGNPIAAQFLSAMTDEKATKATVQDSFAKFGDKAVRPGDSWEVDDETDLGLGKSRMKRKYTVEAEDKVGDRKTLRIKVSITGTIEIDTNQGGQKVSGSLSVNRGEGTLQFDPVAGLTVTQTGVMEVAGQLQIDVNGMAVTVQTSQKQEQSRELLPKLP